MMSIGLLLISVIVFANVVADTLFDLSPLCVVGRASCHIIVWVTFFGISSCARYDGHVCVDLLPNMLKGKGPNRCSSWWCA